MVLESEYTYSQGTIKLNSLKKFFKKITKKKKNQKKKKKKKKKLTYFISTTSNIHGKTMLIYTHEHIGLERKYWLM